MTAVRPDPDWLAARTLACARDLRAAVSRSDLLRRRAGFGWEIRPASGSILASPRMGDWAPEPDYFHHWIRDAAIALSAVPLAIEADPEAGAFWRQAVRDHVDFSLHISDPDRRGPEVNPLKPATRPDFQRFLRPDAELAGLAGTRWLEEPRFVADGTPDLENWSRPQDDGPALRAAGLMRLQDFLPEANGEKAETLIARDLAHVLAVAGRPAIGPWEEAPARRTTFTLISQWDALDRAAARGQSGGDWRGAAEDLEALIASAGDPESGGWRESIEAPEGRFDSATVLALLHAGRTSGPLAMHAPGTLSTVAALERTFAALYPINRGRTVPAIGRWREDLYFDGNPWVPNTLGFAELHYHIAAGNGDRAAFDKADAWLCLIAEIAPDPAIPLPEQFDRSTGAPLSCLALTWSAAAFLGASAARRAALQAMAR
ncbi:glycoside hydrolase family 15 protein [Sulfitobacter sp. LCG007]